MKCTMTILFMIHIINCQQSEFERYFTDWKPGNTSLASTFNFKVNSVTYKYTLQEYQK